jgi:hypothetical protein
MAAVASIRKRETTRTNSSAVAPCVDPTQSARTGMAMRAGSPSRLSR